MQITDKVTMVKNLIDDMAIQSNLVEAYLGLAKSRILDRLYPFGAGDNEMPSQYDHLQCEIAVRMIAKRGGEGELSHAENGISRSWSNTDEEDLLRRVTPYIGVI